MAVQAAERWRLLSKLLFNAQHRIGVAAVFEDDSLLVSYEEVAQRAGVSRSVVHKELGVLVRIRAVSRVDVGRSVLYQRAESSFWAFLDELRGLEE
jgi:predicted nucleotidyltransferase